MKLDKKTSSLIVLLLILAAGPARPDDLLMETGKALKPSQLKIVEEKVKSLRESDHLRRFENILAVLRLDRVAVPTLVKEIETGSNPITVRCSLLALAEIAPPGAEDVLCKVLSAGGHRRDEKTMAALGLGKMRRGAGCAQMEKLLKPGGDRLVRKACSLALAMQGSDGLTGTLLKMLRKEKDDRVAATFILAAAVADGERFTVALPGLLKTQNNRPRRMAIMLGAAFISDPSIKGDLLKHGQRDSGLRQAASVCLGRHHGSEVRSFLVDTIRGSDEAAALDALYSLASAFGESAAPLLLQVALNSPRSPAMRSHALLAAADGGVMEAMLGQSRRSLADSSPDVRSAAALALGIFGQRNSVSSIRSALDVEKDPAVAVDFVIVIGLLGNPQDADIMTHWIENDHSGLVAPAALLARKVLKGKTDSRVLADAFERRVAALSGRWAYRFRDAFVASIRYGMELDTILRRVTDDSGESGGGDSSSGSGGDSSGGDSGGDDAGGNDSSGGGAEQLLLYDGGSGQGENGKKKFILRGEVVEWDILHWFEKLGYFPDSLFRKRP